MSVIPMDGPRPPAGPFACLDPEHALSLMTVYRTACVATHADALLPEPAAPRVKTLRVKFSSAAPMLSPRLPSSLVSVPSIGMNCRVRVGVKP